MRSIENFPIDNFNVLGTIKICFLVFETLLFVKAKWIDDEGVKSSLVVLLSTKPFVVRRRLPLASKTKGVTT
jgi:hypothetical protein